MPNTVVFYDGPSRLNRQPIIALLTNLKRSSKNSKTGHMLATYILVRDEPPVDALRHRTDVAVCGGCPLRPDRHALPKLKRACYVNVGQAPTSMWQAFRRGSYPQVGLRELTQLGRGQVVRLGSYGDPAAVPITYWDALLRDAAGHTGYTHQWRSPKHQAYRRYCQASVEDEEGLEAAKALGWGTFAVLPIGESPRWDQHRCPASAEAGYTETCATCRACGGTSVGVHHIAIQAHGAGRSHVPVRPLPLLAY